MKNIRTFLVSLAFLGLSINFAAAQNVCEIGSTGYTSIIAAIEAVPLGQTTQTVIKLLTNITDNSEVVYIQGKLITFNLNGFDLIFTGNGLIVQHGSMVNYTGTGAFKIISSVTSPGDAIGFHALNIENNSTLELTSVEIMDNGIGTHRVVRAIYIGDYSTVTVNGDVKAIGNNSIGSVATGVYADDSAVTVTVKGNVISSEVGMMICGWAWNTLTVEGTITAQPATYLNVGGFSGDYRTIFDFNTPTTKPGYLTYAKGSNKVWVKYQSVTEIIDVPKVAVVGKPLPLTGTIVPNYVFHQDIVWSVLSAGTTGAVILNNTFYATATGTALIQATVGNGIAFDEDYTELFFITVSDGVGIDEMAAEIINLYPNPTSGELRVESGELKVEKVYILDVTGRIIFTTTEPSINISHLANGVYFVKITTNAGEIVKKVLKK